MLKHKIKCSFFIFLVFKSSIKYDDEKEKYDWKIATEQDLSFDKVFFLFGENEQHHSKKQEKTNCYQQINGHQNHD